MIPPFINSATSISTIQKLRAMFATHGLPKVVVSDNGSVFTSSEFQQFMTKNGIQHIRTAPYHPASNGLAERAVQTVKEGLRKLSGGCLETNLSWFLLHPTLPLVNPLLSYYLVEGHDHILIFHTLT